MTVKIWRVARVLFLAWGGSFLSACASLPPPVEKPPEHAFAQPETTALGRLVKKAAPNPSLSGMRLLISGEEAFGALAALADRAERSLDLQYYIITNEASSRTLLRRVYAAAGRGVRVRLLVDDLNTAGEDESLLCLTSHPNIAVRLYNPLPAGRFSTITRVVSSLTDAKRINQRMHSKMFVADNALAVTGGRNLGDAYFLQSPKSNFVDLDVMVAGPAVRMLSDSFDRFWNSELAYPVEVLVKSKPDCAGAVSAKPAGEPASRASGTKVASAAGAPPSQTGSAPQGASQGEGTTPAWPGNATGEPLRDSVPIPDVPLARDMSVGRLSLAWVPIRVLADKPSKISSEGAPDRSETLADDIIRMVRGAKRELTLISPYFVPGERGIELIREMRQRGVKVRVLTNSLAATDSPVVHIGYARARPELLKLGVELYELRNQLGGEASDKIGSYGTSEASLHAKALVIDHATLLVGSMNMDPRSAWLNTELGLVTQSPELSRQVERLFNDVTRGGSYRVELAADGELLRWIPPEPEATPIEGKEPDASLGLRLMLKLLSPFAPDAML